MDEMELEDLIAKAAVAVEAHAVASERSRKRLARLSVEAEASLRAISNESRSGEGLPRGAGTAGSKLDVQR